MNVRIRLFAAARELIDADEVVVHLPTGGDISQLRTALATTAPQLAPLASRSLFAINNEYATEEHPVQEGDEIALIPPVSGG